MADAGEQTGAYPPGSTQHGSLDQFSTRELWDVITGRGLPADLGYAVLKAGEIRVEENKNEAFASEVKSFLTADRLTGSEQYDFMRDVIWKNGAFSSVPDLAKHQLKSLDSTAKACPPETRILAVPHPHPSARPSLAEFFGNRVPGRDRESSLPAIVMPEDPPELRSAYKELIAHPQKVFFNDTDGHHWGLVSRDVEGQYVSRARLFASMAAVDKMVETRFNSEELWSFVAMDVRPDPPETTAKGPEALGLLSPFDSPEARIMLQGLLKVAGLTSQQAEHSICNEMVARMYASDRQRVQPLFAAMVVTDPATPPGIELSSVNVSGLVPSETPLSTRGAISAL